MNLDLSDEQKGLQESLRALCARDRSRTSAWDREQRFPWEAIGPLARAPARCKKWRSPAIAREVLKDPVIG